MDLARSAWWKLVNAPSVTGLLGSDATWGPWVFRYDPRIALESTGKSMIVVNRRGGWASANAHNSWKFPSLQVEIFSDPDRETTGQPDNRFAPEKCDTIYRAVDALLHRPGGMDELWGDTGNEMRILACVRSGEPDLQEVPEGDGMYRNLVRYDVTVD